MDGGPEADGGEPGSGSSSLSVIGEGPPSVVFVGPPRHEVGESFEHAPTGKGSLELLGAVWIGDRGDEVGHVAAVGT